MENIIIRNARIEDIYKIADIKIEGWQTAYKGIVDDKFLDGLDRKKEIEKLKNNMEKGISILVAEFNNDIIGFCLYRNFNDNKEKYLNVDSEISSLYVKSEFKRNGIGRQLMKCVIQKLKNEGKRKMILGCLKENYESRAFYEKMGGKVIDYNEIELENKKYELVIYEYNNIVL